MARELMAIKAACWELQVDYESKITYIMEQKRHHTRFFPMDQYKYSENRNNSTGTMLVKASTIF